MDFGLWTLDLFYGSGLGWAGLGWAVLGLGTSDLDLGLSIICHEKCFDTLNLASHLKYTVNEIKFISMIVCFIWLLELKN